MLETLYLVPLYHRAALLSCTETVLLPQILTTAPNVCKPAAENSPNICTFFSRLNN